MIPLELRPIFWDVDPGAFDPTRYPEYTIRRVLELGDEKAVAWLRDTFPEARIENVVRDERRLSRRSAGFWALVYKIPANDVAALRHRSERFGA
jgi:hypothetical protein